jgi:hypothetical protein
VCVVGAYDLVGEGEKKRKRLEFELRLGEEIQRLEEEETVSFVFLGSDSQQSFVGRIDFSFFLVFLVVWVVVGFLLFFLTDFFVSRKYLVPIQSRILVGEGGRGREERWQQCRLTISDAQSRWSS